MATFLGTSATSFVLAAALSLLVGGCTAARHVPQPPVIELPSRSEPAYESIPSAGLVGVPMARIASTAKLKKQLEVRFPALDSPRANLHLDGESFIRHEGKVYRRVHFWYEDTATENMHGSCSQSIALWFEPSGTLVETYVAEMVCPI